MYYVVAVKVLVLVSQEVYVILCNTVTQVMRREMLQCGRLEMTNWIGDLMELANTEMWGNTFYSELYIE